MSLNWPDHHFVTHCPCGFRRDIDAAGANVCPDCRRSPLLITRGTLAELTRLLGLMDDVAAGAGKPTRQQTDGDTLIDWRRLLRAEF